MNNKEKEDMRWPAQVLILVVVLLFMFSRTCKAQVVFHHLDSNFSSVTKIEYKDDSLFVTVFPYDQPKGVPDGMYYRFSYIIKDKRLVFINRKKYFVNQF